MVRAGEMHMSVDDWPSGAIQFCWRPMCVAMPKAGELVLLFADEKAILGIWADDSPHPHWIDFFSGQPVRNITHWMPIPPPTKSDSADSLASTSFNLEHS
jgi:hypothetical protein